MQTIDLTLAFVVLGCFYTFAGVVGARAALMDALMDAALAGTSGQKHPKLDLERSAVLLAMVCIVGAGGMLLGVGSNVALPVFLMSCALQVIYYFVLSPKRYDVEDPVPEEGRQKSINALVLYVIVTCFVAWATWTGALRPINDLNQMLMTSMGLVWLSACIWAFHWLFTIDKRPKRNVFGAWDDSKEGSASSDDDYVPYNDDEAQAALKLWAETAQLYLRPASRFSPLFDAATDEMLSWDELAALETPDDVRANLIKYGAYCTDAIAADDPLSTRLVAGVTMDELTARGQTMFAQLQAHLSHRVTFRPDLKPQSPLVHPLRLDLGIFADSTCIFEGWPPNADGNDIWPYDLAVSTSLLYDIGEWSFATNDHAYRKTLPPPDTASPEELGAIIKTGRMLAERLVKELAQTGRAHVPVYYHAPDGHSEHVVI